MRAYWIRIALGALAIFLVGYLGMNVVRASVGKVHRMTESSDPISIPLAFVPFNLDGARQGTFRGLIIERSTPRTVEAFRARVALGDSVDVARLQACQLVMEGGGRDFDPGRGFRCVAPAEGDSALVPFGAVVFVGKDGSEFSVPFLLDSAAARDLRTEGTTAGEAAKAAAESEAAAARAEADRIRVDVRSRVDSAVRRARVRQAPPPPTP